MTNKMQLPIVHDNAVTTLIGKFDKIPSLDREEEFELAVRLREKGDIDAAQRLITANLRNVVRIAMDYAGYRLPLEDIVQEGTIGLMIAVKKFDPHKGYRLMTYAVWWIKAMIHDYILRFYSQVKLGTTKLQKKLFYGLNRMLAEEDVMDGNTTERSRALSARLDADPHQIEEIISRLMNKDQSLNSPVTEGGDISFLDFLMDTKSDPENQIMESQRVTFVKSQIDNALSKLTPREQEIARRRLMAENPQTLEDLGRQYAISKERVRQIESKVKVKLKQALAGHIDFMMQE
jgi:RNA polymerase sigma-32 factor